MIDVLVLATLVILAAFVIIWIVGPRVRAHVERPKHEVLERIAGFETVHPRREVVDLHAKSASR
jgi:hypothetical protein